MNTDQLLSALENIKKRLEAMESNSQGGRIYMRTQEELDLSLAKQICIEMNMAHNFKINVEIITKGTSVKEALLVTLKVSPGVSSRFLDDNGNIYFHLDQHVLALIQKKYISEGGKTTIALCMQFGQS